jgi:hypothetical protein
LRVGDGATAGWGLTPVASKWMPPRSRR